MFDIRLKTNLSVIASGIPRTDLNQLIIGLSTDTKPVSPLQGWCFLETDTGKIWYVVGGVWTEPTSGSGTVDTANSPNINEFARFTDADTIEGRTVSETKTDLSLNNVDNTSDANKPVSTAQQAALDLKAPLAGPTFTGTVTIPTPFTLGAVSVLPTGTELNFVDGVTSGIQGQLDGKAASSHTHDWADVTGEPTTLAGYGITDGATDAELSAHESDATNVHGIADTSLLALTTRKLDDFGAPDDNTDLNASAVAHGLMQKYPGGTTTFLRADGTFAAPTAAAADPSYSPGSFTVTTETQRFAPHRLKMTTSQRITIEGTGRLSCLH